MITPSLPSEPQADFPSNRWATLRRDLADFLASPWAVEAVRFGWTEIELFGVDANRPFARIDGFGLVPALDGCRIIELDATGAVLETQNGIRQSYQRKFEQPGRVPVWRLAK
jgi:hypothetical protein